MDMVTKIFYIFVFVIFLHFAESANAQSTARFTPFTYEEMAAPLRAYTNFFNQCCETLIDLMENAEQIEPYINKEKEPITWQRYCNYYNSIVNEYNSINKQGTNTGTRGRINNLKRNFSRVINDIANTYNRRNQLANNQFQRIQSTKERCDRYFSDIPLDEFLDGKTPSIKYYTNDINIQE